MKKINLIDLVRFLPYIKVSKHLLTLIRGLKGYLLISLTTLFINLNTTPLYPINISTNNSVGYTISFNISESYLPKSITDLEAAASATQEGAILLIWTAPAEDDVANPSNNPVTSYQVRYGTFTVSNLSNNTTTWWDNAKDAIGEPSSPLAPGNQESFLVTGLEPGATIYFGIKSLDESGNISIIDRPSENSPQANALALDTAPPVVVGVSTTLAISSIAVSWTASTATDITSYRIYWDTSNPADIFVATVTVSSNTTSYTFSDLDDFNTYYFYVTALDKGAPSYLGTVLESSSSSVVNAFSTVASHIPITANNIIANTINITSITWQWQDNSNNETGFRIYSSTDGIMGTVSTGTIQFTETGLNPNTNYTRYVKSFNNVGESLASATTARYTLANPPLTTTVSNVFLSSLTVSWAANSNPQGTTYQVQSSTDTNFSIFNTSLVSDVSLSTGGLKSSTTYYFRVRAKNGEEVLTSFDTTVSTLTLAISIVNLTATAGDQSVTLNWDDATPSDLSGYFVYRSSQSDQSFSKLNLTEITTSYYEDSGLTNGTTYFYKVTSLNTSSLEGPFSSTVSARPVKINGPVEPTGILGSLNSAGQFTINWSPVTKDTAGSSRVELAAYRLYKSNSIDSLFTYTAAVSSNTHSWTAADLVPPTVWYLVRAIDTSDNESINSMRIETTASPTLGVATKDETIHIKIPASQANIFSASKNNLSEDVRMVLDRKSEDEKGTTLTSYEIKTVGANSGSEIKDLKIKEPIVEVQLRYTQGKSGSPLPISTVLRAFPGSPRDVGIFWHNGVEFVKFGGAVNESKGTVSVKTSKPTGKFQVRQVLRATEFTLTQLTPRKIFTPNGDGVNDEIILFLENPKESTISQAKLYDISGAEIADFEQGFVVNNQGIISLKWDGRDHSGVVVRSGIYIYQVQAEGKVINGTIVVAR